MCQAIPVLPTGDEMDISHPRSEFLHSTKPIPQETVIPEPGFGILVLRVVYDAFCLCELLLPDRVVHIHPSYNEINIHILHIRFHSISYLDDVLQTIMF